MPEYSSTTITPADGVKTPAMNGSTSGNYTLSALRDFILASKGQANGLASLDANGKLPSSQLPDLADDVIVVASYATLPAIGTAGKIYITADNNKMYRWDSDLATPNYVELSVDLSAYATKAELAAEESARESEDSNLKDAIDSNSQRIENLEVAVSGSLVQTNVLTDPPSMANVRTITNANEILPWAILKRVGARAVSWNQLAPELTSANYQTGVATITDGVATGTRSSAGWIIGRDGFQWQAHVYIAMVKVKLTSNTTAVYLRCAGVNRVATQATTSWQTLVALFTPDPSGTGIAVNDTRTGSWDAVSVKEFQVFDITDMNMASLTANQFRSLFPASYYPYDEGHIYDLNPSGMKVVWKNKVDSLLVGYFNGVNFDINSEATNFRSVKIWLANGTYTISSSIALNYVRLIKDGEAIGNPISSVTSYTFTCSTTGWVGLSFRDATSSSTPWSDSNTIQLEVGSTATAYEEYKETTIDTSDVPEGYVDSEHYNYKENVLVDGVMRGAIHVVIGEYTFTGNEIWTANGSSRKTDVLTDLIKHYTNQALAIILCEGLEVTTPAKLYDGTVTSGIASYDGYIRVAEGDVANMAGKKMYYELATETVTYVNPIPNLPVEDGTTVTAITPQTDLVNAIDVPSTIAYMTKISS